MPYYLASMHPILHFSLLTTSLIFQIFYHDKFFLVPNDCTPTEPKAIEFLDTGKYWLTGYICVAHALAIVFHYVAEVLISMEYKIVSNIFVLLKIFVYFFAVFVV